MHPADSTALEGVDHWAGALVPAWSFMSSTSAATLPASVDPVCLSPFSERGSVLFLLQLQAILPIDPLDLALFGGTLLNAQFQQIALRPKGDLPTSCVNGDSEGGGFEILYRQSTFQCSPLSPASMFGKKSTSSK